MAQKQNRNSPETESSREKPRRGNRMVEHHVYGFVGGEFSILSAIDRNWRRSSRLQIRRSGLVSLENQNGRTSASSALRRVLQAPGCSRVPSEPFC